MKKEKIRDYEVQAKLTLYTSTTVSARSLEEATEKSKNLKEQDFVDFNGDYIDGNMRITGVYESGFEL